jgi:hypothetical protein
MVSFGAPEPPPAPPPPAPTPPTPAIVRPAPPASRPSPRRGAVLGEIGPSIGVFSAPRGMAAVPRGGDGAVTFTRSDGSTGNCLVPECAYYLDDDVVPIVGAGGFVGWAATERLLVGLRAYGGYMVGYARGWNVSVGPSVSARLAGPLWIGASLLLGDVSVTEPSALVNAHDSTNYGSLVQTRHELQGGTDVTIGNSIEASLALLETPRGALMLQLTPSILLGSRDLLVTVPVGVTWRFY